MDEHDDELLVRDPPRVVGAAYVLAAVCALVPLAVIGAAFAGVALMRRNRPVDGARVLLLAVVCTAAGVLLFR